MYSNGGIYVPDRKPPLGAKRNPYLLINRNLIAAWDMLAGAGLTVEDKSGNWKVGTFGAGGQEPVWQEGKFGPNVYFDGTDKINAPSLGTLALPITIVATIKRSALGAWDPILLTHEVDNKYYGANLAINPSNKVQLWYGDGDGNTSADRRTKIGLTSLAVDRYYCIIGVIRSATDMDIYIDSVNDGGAYSGTGFFMSTANGVPAIGRFISLAADKYFTGTIGHVDLYDRDLTNKEVTQLTQEPFCGYRWPSLVERIAGAGVNITVLPATLELALTQHALTVSTANTKLLLHFEGADESTDFTDSSDSGHADTAINDAQIDTAQKYFNDASGLFDGTGDCVLYPNHVDWDRGAGHYTIDCRVRLNANGKVQWIVAKNSAPTYYQIGFFINASNFLCGRCDKTAGPTIFNSVASNRALAVDTWYHVAMVINRTTNKMMLFVNGFECTYSTQDTIDGTAYTNTVPLIIGSVREDGSQANFDGWIDELRMSKGIMRWSSNFTPPNAPYNSCYVELATQALALTQHAPVVTYDFTIFPATQALALTQHAPVVTYDFTIFPATQALALTQHAVLAYPLSTVLLTTQALALTQHAPVVTYDFTIFPATQALALTQHAPSIVISSTILMETQALTLTQQSLTVRVFYIAIPSFILETLLNPYSGEAWLWLAEIIVPNFDTVRIAKNTAKVIYDENTYPKSNFEVEKQKLSGDGSIPSLAFRVAHDEVHNLEAIMNASKGMKQGYVKLIRTCESFLDTPVQDFETIYSILTAGSDSEWIVFSLGIPNPLTQKIPRDLYSSSVCNLATPSLFKGVKCRYGGADTTCTGLFEDCYMKGNAQHWGAELGLDPSSIKV